VFRLSGGEPFLVFDTYKDLVTEYYQKMDGKFTFGMLTNLTHLTDEMADWMVKNDIGCQVSIDDMDNSKPLVNGKSSSEITLKNVVKLMAHNIMFSFNTVLDISKTKSLIPLANYICSFKKNFWGLNASYTSSNKADVEQTKIIFKEAVDYLVAKNFSLNGLRFYNMIVNQPRNTCSAGRNIFALGTNLDVWPCQSMLDSPPLGFFDEHIFDLLREAEANRYFYESGLLPECIDCNILQWCRGGCRATHQNKDIVAVTCEIKRDIFDYIVQKANEQQYRGKRQNQYRSYNNINDQNQGNKFDMMIQEYISSNKDSQQYIQTPDFDALSL
jgi:radical SAM protein with 4Fe4S-binding SPASM domain